MLEYLNGIGAPRRGRGVRRKLFAKSKSILSKLPASKVAKELIKKGKGKISPLMKSKLTKLAFENKRRLKFKNEGEPLTSAYDYENNFEQGNEEIREPEFNYEDTHGEMGLIYPTAIGGRRDRRIKRREAREKRKQERSERKNLKAKSKAEARTTRAEAKRLRGEGKRLKGEKGGFDFKGALDTVATTAKDVFGKGTEVKEAYEDFKSGASSRMATSDATAEPTSAPMNEPTFMEKYKTPLIIGGSALVLGGIYFATKKK